jgi:hypothetical protein
LDEARGFHRGGETSDRADQQPGGGRAISAYAGFVLGGCARGAGADAQAGQPADEHDDRRSCSRTRPADRRAGGFRRSTSTLLAANNAEKIEQWIVALTRQRLQADVAVAGRPRTPLRAPVLPSRDCSFGPSHAPSGPVGMIAFVIPSRIGLVTASANLNHADHRGLAPPAQLHSCRLALGGAAERALAMPRTRSRRPGCATIAFVSWSLDAARGELGSLDTHGPNHPDAGCAQLMGATCAGFPPERQSERVRTRKRP